MTIFKCKACDYESLIDAYLSRNYSEGRTYCGRLNFTGTLLKSYNTPVAEIRNGYIVITDRKYSNTTSKQLRILRSSISDMIELPYSLHPEQSIYDKLADLFAKYKRARSRKPLLEIELRDLIDYTYKQIDVIIQADELEFTMEEEFRELIFNIRLNLVDT